MRQYIILLLLSTVLALLNTSCKKNPTEPDLPEPGRRDYVWTVDTLDPGPGNIFYAYHVYGETSDDIWTVGGVIGGKDIWHFDGNKWKEEQIGIINIRNILGFSKKDIWVCGSTSFGHYNGQQWQKYPNVAPSGYLNVSFMAMAASAPNDIYAAGVTFEKDGQTPKSLVAHFDGTEWKLMNIPNMPAVSFNDIKKDKATGKYFITSYDWQGGTNLYRVHLLQGNSVKEIYSDNKPITVNYLNGECYFAAGKKIFKYRNDTMELWKDFSGTNYSGFLWGRNESDIFTLNDFALGHYNGRDLTDIFKTDLWIREGLLFKNEVFFVCFYPEKKSATLYMEN